MIVVADEDEGITFFGELDGFDVNFGDQRASGIDDAQAAALAVFADFGRDAVSAVNDALAVGNFVLAIDEDGALAAEFVNHKAVVYDLFADVDGRPESFEGDADNVNGANDAGAEAAWLQ